jgi:hypothetical protein
MMTNRLLHVSRFFVHLSKLIASLELFILSFSLSGEEPLHEKAWSVKEVTKLTVCTSSVKNISIFIS